MIWFIWSYVRLTGLLYVIIAKLPSTLFFRCSKCTILIITIFIRRTLQATQDLHINQLKAILLANAHDPRTNRNEHSVAGESIYLDWQNICYMNDAQRVWHSLSNCYFHRMIPHIFCIVHNNICIIRITFVVFRGVTYRGQPGCKQK